MPVIEAHVLEGYSDDDKARICRALTDAIRSVIPAPPEAVTVMLHEMSASHYSRGGAAREPAPALPDPQALVRRFLDAMEARDLPAAQAMLAEGFEMRFPGTAPMHGLQELVDWSKPRYRFVRKSYARFDTAAGADCAVVHCHGTLRGEWPDGSAFEGIRFIDRFEVRDGRIARQDVWNDIAEVRP